jgi:hypothetical protein
MQQLAEGIEKYRSARGSLPMAGDIVALTDTLYPTYMSTLVREDGWGDPIVYEVTGPATFRLISVGPDRRRGTSDDIVIESGRPAAP